MGLNPPTFVPTEQVPAQLSGTVWATCAGAFGTLATTFSLFTPNRWQDWAALVCIVMFQLIIVVGSIWFNRKSIVPPGGSRQ